MGRADLIFRGLTPDQVDALNACYRLLHAQDISERKADIQRTAKELSTAITTPPIVEERAPSSPPFIGFPAAPESIIPSALTAAPASPPPPAAPWETAATPPVAPPPAPVPSAPPAPVASNPTAGASAGSPQNTLFDQHGTPYNAELHAPLTGTTAGKQADGSWKRKRSASQEAYNSWRIQFAKATPAAPPTAPNAATLNAQYGAPPVNNGTAPPPLPPASQFFAGASETSDTSEPDLDAAPHVDQAAFLTKAAELTKSGVLTQAIAIGIMKHPKILAADNVDVGRDPEKRRRAFRLLELAEQGTWPKAA